VHLVRGYRDLLSAIFKRAERMGLIPRRSNPVTDVPKFKENNQRLAFLGPDEEAALLGALPTTYRPDFIISINTGLRWSEQMNLRWKDVDLLTGFITVPRSKHGESRRVPINSAVRSALIDLGSGERTDSGSRPVFPGRPAQADKYFPKAVEGAKAALKAAGKDTSRLADYCWHSNRHTFASRCVMAGVDPRTLQELGGWKSFAMLNRYSHLAPGHLQAAVERIVARPAEALTVR
jgi:integrase